jgi:hypothetical protein
MTQYKLICVGGTGQMVLHYYIQLYLLGLIEYPSEAVVLDTDRIIASLSSAGEFLADLQFGADARDGIEGEIGTIATPQVPAPTSDRVVTALTGRQEANGHHAARAFFNSETLAQTVNQGLFARPALSSVMSHRVFADSALTPVKDSTLVFVGSVIGGTSGGLLAPLVDAVQARQVDQNISAVKMRAVLYGQYFTPDDAIIPNAIKRFNSNQVFVLNSIKEALEKLHSYYIIGGTGPMDRTRDPNLEKNASQLPWPDEDDPFWQGPQATSYLLTDKNIPEATDFRDREVLAFKQPIDRARADQARRQRLSFVDFLIGKKVVTRLAADPFAVAIWGRKFTDLLAGFWEIAVVAEGGKKVNDFPRKVQEALETLWKGSEERLGLLNLFPPTPTESISPGNVARVDWPALDQAKRLKTLFSNADVVAQRAAATILFTALKKGT